jgi:hypothetical protein
MKGFKQSVQALLPNIVLKQKRKRQLFIIQLTMSFKHFQVSSFLNQFLQTAAILFLYVFENLNQKFSVFTLFEHLC